MKKILETIICIAALAAGVILFFHFDMEEILLEKADMTPVSQAEIEADTQKDYAGLPGGEGVTELKSADQWNDIISDLDFVTVAPKAIHQTDVYTLAKWESFFNHKANGTTGYRRREVKKSSLDYSLLYCPVYVIELPDGTHVLAQMSRCYAKRLEKGEAVILPLGTRRGMLEKTRNLLKDECARFEAPDDYILYTINNQWQGEHASTIFIAKFAVAFAVGFVLAVVLIGIANKLLRRN